MATAGLWAGLRRWWLFLAIAAVCTGLALVQVVRAAPVYWTQVTVVFLRPAGEEGSNVLAGDEESLIHFAAIIEREFNGAPRSAQVASPNATLYGQGIREGVDVSLPNGGGQWKASFRHPALYVQVVDASEVRVRDALGDTLARIDALVEDQQRESGVSPNNMISTSIAPASALVTQVGGRESRAVLSTLILAAGLTVGVFVGIDRRNRSRRSGALAEGGAGARVVQLPDSFLRRSRLRN